MRGRPPLATPPGHRRRPKITTTARKGPRPHDSPPARGREHAGHLPGTQSRGGRATARIRSPRLLCAPKHQRWAPARLPLSARAPLGPTGRVCTQLPDMPRLTTSVDSVGMLGSARGGRNNQPHQGGPASGGHGQTARRPPHCTQQVPWPGQPSQARGGGTFFL